MAKQNLLSAAFVRNISDPGMHADGNGLFLRVSRTGSKSWIYRYRWNGKRPEIGLGGLTSVTLAQAREAAEDCRRQIRAGIDPRIDRCSHSTGVPTFKNCAQQFIEDRRAEWSNKKHRAQWSATLETYAHPVIGNKPVHQIDIEDVLAVLRPIWETRTETASRVRGRIENILSWAVVRGYRKPPNPAIWRGNLDMLLPKPTKVKKVRHHPALPYEDLPRFMHELRSKNSLTAKALEFTILTTARTGEVIAARWSEFDLKRAVWTVPAERMKANREHRVPLVPAVVQLLESLPRMDGGQYVFPGMREGKHISNMGMLLFLKRDLEYPGLTVHGFRSTLEDRAVETTAHPTELSEAQLAHVIRNGAQAAYERGDKLKRRRELLEAWTAFCGSWK